MSLRNQTFFCLLVPIVIIYYTKLTLEDYIKALFSRHYEEESREEKYLSDAINDSAYKTDRYIGTANGFISGNAG